MISVLFAEKNGIYSSMNIDLWDKERDALNFNYKYPVVCHPPCQLWGRFAKINYKRWGGDHNKPKNDGGMFKFALDMVRRNGGVLEHPAFTYAWKEYDLPKPIGIGWNNIGNDEYVCEVWQSAYGHLARKRTWLFYKGIKPFDLRWERPSGSYQIGFYDQRGKARNKPTLSGKKASATPQDFAIELVILARLNQSKESL